MGYTPSELQMVPAGTERPGRFRMWFWGLLGGWSVECPAKGALWWWSRRL